MGKNNILFELLFEDIPFNEIEMGFSFFKDNILEKLNKNNLIYDEIKFYYTRNRFVMFISNILDKSPDEEIEIMGPPRDISFNEGMPTKALIGFCKKNNILPEDVLFKEKKGREYVFAKKTKQGEKTSIILANLLQYYIEKIPFKKTMNLDDKQRFIRPIRKVSYFIDNKPHPLKIFNVESSNITQVDHFLKTIEIKSIDNYFHTLDTNDITLSQENRENIIKSFIEKLQKDGYSFKINAMRLQYLSYFSEKPQIIVGNFDEKFLKLPEEMIDITLWKHQKAILMLENEKPTNKYFTICDKGKDIVNVIKDYNEVILSRFDDAEFFYNNDLNTPLEQFIQKQKSAIYFENWGTYEKFIEYATYVGEKINEFLPHLNSQLLKKAIYYSKFDLFTNVVSEKTYADLQGIMGYYYLLHNNVEKEVAIAVREQYLPEGEDSNLPRTEYGAILSIINKLILLSIVFHQNLKVSGSKDIYGVRRAALGMYKVIVKFQYNFNIFEILKRIDFLSPDNINNIYVFIIDRIKAYERTKINPEIIDAALYYKNGKLYELHNKIVALHKFSRTENFESTKITLKRVLNILGDDSIDDFDEHLLIEKEEKKLYEEFQNFKENLKKSENKYEDIFMYILQLKPHIDNFFDNVLVNVDNEKLRNNRKGLLTLIGKEILKIANFKHIS